MQSNDAIILVAEIKKTPYSERIKKLSTREWDFINSIEHWAQSGRKLTSKQGWRLQEIYRIAMGAYSKRYSNIETLKKKEEWAI
jgi:hypothetical protein